MADTGVTYPGTAATEAVSPEDDNNWSSPDNIKADDTSYARCFFWVEAGKYSYRLKATNFGFSLPTHLRKIDGLVVEIAKHHSSTTAGVKDYRVQLLDADGVLVGDNKAVLGVNWPLSVPGKVTYGGAADKWNAALMKEMVEDANFGVVLSARCVNTQYYGYVDYIRITIYYSEVVAPTVTTQDATDIGFD